MMDKGSLAALFILAMTDVQDSIFHLTRVQRAVVAALSLVMMGTVAGAFAAGQLDIPRRVASLESAVRDTVFPRQSMMEERDTEIFEEFTRVHKRLGEIICEMNGVQIQVCTFWLNEGRPENLRTSGGLKGTE